MPIDTSIYGNITPIDPLGQLNKLAATSQALTEAKSARFGLQGKVALGQHIQDAIDPATGQVDTNKLVMGIKSDPAALAAAQAGTEEALTQRGGQIANANAGMNLNQSGFTNLSNAFAAKLAQNKGPVSSGDLAGIATDLLTQGRITPDLFKGVMKTLPMSGEDARPWAAGGFVSTLPQGIVAGAAPAPPGPNGAPRQQSGGQFVSQTLGAGSNGGVAGGATPPGAGAVTTGLGPGQEAAISTTGQANAGMGVNLTSLANQVPDRLAMLNNMEAEANQFTAGPVSEDLKKLTAGANEVFGTKFNVEGVAAQERFDKLSNQIAQQQAGALGITDQRERTAMGANPNSSMSNLGIHGNIALLKGNEDAIRAKANGWQTYLDNGGTPDQYGAWSNGFNRNYDPRIFQSVYLEPADRAKIVQAMNPQERKAFATKYNYAVQRGWIPDPREQTNAQ